MKQRARTRPHRAAQQGEMGETSTNPHRHEARRAARHLTLRRARGAAWHGAQARARRKFVGFLAPAPRRLRRARAAPPHGELAPCATGGGKAVFAGSAPVPYTLRFPSTRKAFVVLLYFFVLCNRHRFNRIPGPPPRDGLGVTYLPLALSSDASYATYP